MKIYTFNSYGYSRMKGKILLTMKFTILLIITAFMQVSAASFAQKKITLSEHNASLQRIMKAIKAQSGYSVFFIQKDIQKANPVSINVKEAALTEALDKCFADQPLTYSIQANTIVIKRKETQLVSNPIFVQTIDVVGKVLDETGRGVPGASIKVKGGTIGTITDNNGQFKLTKVGENATLVFSYIGYVVQEQKATTGAQMIVTLVPQPSALDEVVVVAYGTQKKANLTGAVASITAGQIKDRPVTSMQNALQGLSPGLTIIQRPGDVSSVGSVTLRGRTNLGSPSPMYIIDGIPATSTQFASINPNDVESISVLKDASAASIYGSRAANGVLVVTTKRGSTDGKPSIEFNTTYGIQSPTRLPKYTNAVDYATLYNEALTNAGKAALYTPAQIQKFADGSDPDNYANTDWYKLALKKNPTQSNSTISVSSSGKATNYYLSASYLNQQSLVPNKDQNRYNLNLNADTKVNSVLKVGTNIAYYRQNFDTNGGELNWVSLNRLTPVLAARQSDGTWGTIAGGALSTTLAADNVLRKMAEAGKSYNRNNYLQTAATAVLTPVKGLSINGLVSLKTTNTNSWAFTNTMDPLINFKTKAPITSTAVTVNELQEVWGKTQNFLVQGHADYEYTLQKHYAKIMVGASQESNIFRAAYLGRKNFPNNDLTTIVSGSSAAEDVSTINGFLGNSTSDQEWAMRSFFGRFNYAFDNKYLLEANLRMDYSSRFHPDVRKAVFPSFSAAWRVSQENFMKNISWISDLKLRGSWGMLGNQDAVPLGNYFSLIKTGYEYSFDGTPYDGAWQAAGVNAAATWEKVHMTNFGLDFSTLKGKLNVTADYYIKNTTGILIQRNALAPYALTAPDRNAGSVRNKGLELNVTYSDVIGKDLRYSVTANVSKISNKITGLGGDNNRVSGYYIEKLGEAVGSFYGYQAEGLFKDAADVASHAFQSAGTGPGDIKYKDINGDGKIDAADRTVIGNDVPFLNYGVSLSAAYKGFSLEVLTYGVANVKTYLDNEASTPFFNSAGIKEALKKRWTIDNPDPNADFPRLLRSQDGSQNAQLSSFWLFSGSYFRVRGLTVGYTLPNLITQRLKAQSIRFYITANNPFTYMADKRLADYDPESGSGRGSYPGIKTWSLGASIKF